MYAYHTKMYVNHTLLSLSEMKILEVFLDFQKHYFAELVVTTKLTRPRTLRVLKELVKKDILHVKKEANIKYYFLQKNSLVYSLLSSVEYNKKILFLEKKTTLKRALEMFKEKYESYIVMVLFGSIIKGYASKMSDVDLLLIKEDFSEVQIKKIEDIADLVQGRTGLKISPYFMKIDEFKKKNELAKQVIEKHLVIEGGELFLKMVIE